MRARLVAAVTGPQSRRRHPKTAAGLSDLCATDLSEIASVCATTVPMSGKVWPIWGTDGTITERLAGSLQVRRYIVSCEPVGSSVVGSGAVSKTSTPTS